MKFWKRHSVCAVCGAHFEPVTGYEARGGHLCSMHRKEVRERDEKKEAVISWATANWERLAPMMEKECAEQKNAFDQAMRSSLNNMSAQYQNQCNGLSNAGNSQIRGIFG